MFDQLPRPTIFGHRGASAYAPENTLASFELALKHGADAIELDAKLCADGHVVVIHDQTVNRTTNGKGRVSALALAELKQLDAGSFFDVAYHDEPIPTLEEVFEAVGKRTFINVELTNYASPGDDLPEKVAALIQRHGLADRVLFSSFNWQALTRAKRVLPQAPAGLLALPRLPGILARSRFGQARVSQQALHPEKSDVTPQLVESVHRSGRRVHVYTVNQPDDLRRLFALGVDGVFTDNPLLARQVLTHRA